MRQFNLIDEPWIPVRKSDGSRVELSIRESLLNAKEVAAIEDASPLVTASLHRLLLAVLYRALEGPVDLDQATSYFNSGLSTDKVSFYLDQWRDRFWLFDDDFPFYQIPGFEPKSWRAWTVLAAEHNADNAKVLFDHVDVTHPDSITPGRAARWLLACQTYAVSAGKSELSHTGTAPSATAVMVLPIGRNLEDTLLLNLVPQNRLISDRDLPVWERQPESLATLSTGVKRTIDGHADCYSWRSRSVLLSPETSGQVSKLAFASGVGVANQQYIDPMLGYRLHKENGRQPVQFRERGLWRDFDSLLPDNAKLAPEVVAHATALTRNQRERFPHSVMVLGQANDKAKIKFWRLERFALPKVLLGDRSIRTEIHDLLADAEDNHQALENACRCFARDLLSRGERDIQKKDITNFVKRMPASSHYWTSLETHFHEVIRSYSEDANPNDIRYQWLQSIRSSLRDAWATHANAASSAGAWTIRALIRAEGHINIQLGRLKKELRQYETHRQSEEKIA